MSKLTQAVNVTCDYLCLKNREDSSHRIVCAAIYQRHLSSIMPGKLYAGATCITRAAATPTLPPPESPTPIRSGTPNATHAPPPSLSPTSTPTARPIATPTPTPTTAPAPIPTSTATPTPTPVHQTLHAISENQ